MNNYIQEGQRVKWLDLARKTIDAIAPAEVEDDTRTEATQ